MYYQLTFKISDNRISDADIVEMISHLDYKHVQQLNWTAGHFTVESYENRLLKTLVVFPHYKKPECELQLIQEYILDRLGINYDGIVPHRWISQRMDEIDNELNLPPNNLIIRNYHQDCFFKRILQISIEEKSPSIAAEFYAYYYLDENIIFKRKFDVTVLDDIVNDKELLTQRFRKAYQQRINGQLPIFIVNEQNKLMFEYLREMIIIQIKEDYHLELDVSIQSRFGNNLELSELEGKNTVPFSNNIMGQIWDITFDINSIGLNGLETLLRNNLILTISSNRFRSLIIIRNTNRIAINDWLAFGSFIII